MKFRKYPTTIFKLKIYLQRKISKLKISLFLYYFLLRVIFHLWTDSDRTIELYKKNTRNRKLETQGFDVPSIWTQWPVIKFWSQIQHSFHNCRSRRSFFCCCTIQNMSCKKFFWFFFFLVEDSWVYCSVSFLSWYDFQWNGDVYNQCRPHFQHLHFSQLIEFLKHLNRHLKRCRRLYDGLLLTVATTNTVDWIWIIYFF